MSCCDMCCCSYCNMMMFVVSKLERAGESHKNSGNNNEKYSLKTLCHCLAICQCAHAARDWYCRRTSSEYECGMLKEWDILLVLYALLSLFPHALTLHSNVLPVVSVSPCNMHGFEYGRLPRICCKMCATECRYVVRKAHIFAAVYLHCVWWFANRANNWSNYKQLTNYQSVLLVVMCLCIHRTKSSTHTHTHTLHCSIQTVQ